MIEPPSLTAVPPDENGKAIATTTEIRSPSVLIEKRISAASHPLRTDNMLRLVCTIIAATTLVGCGGGRSGPSSAEVDAELSLVQLEFTSNVAAEAKDGSGDPAMATADLIAFVRRHKATLGDDRARRILSRAAGDVGPWCAPCADRIERASDSL